MKSRKLQLFLFSREAQHHDESYIMVVAAPTVEDAEQAILDSFQSNAWRDQQGTILGPEGQAAWRGSEGATVYQVRLGVADAWVTEGVVTVSRL